MCLINIKKHFSVCKLLFEKEGDRERVREWKWERYGEWERSTQFGEGHINIPSNKGRVGKLLELDELLWPSMTFEVILMC